MNFRSPLLLFASLLSATLVGCASGPEFSKYSATLKRPAETGGRIWFYRPSKMIGAAIQPYVYLNDQLIAKAQPGCYFYADRPAGDYEVKCSTEWDSKKTVHLAAGDEKFVRLTMSPGVFVGHIIPSESDRAKGLKEIQDCKLITVEDAYSDFNAK